MMKVLNLGAGSLQPLQTSDLKNIADLRDAQIVNVDIYNQIVVYTPDRSKIPFPDAEICYSDVEKKIEVDSETIDLAIAVSPYGYSVLNREVHRVLKPGAKVLVMGNNRNKYATKLGSLCTPFMAGQLSDHFEKIDSGDLLLQWIRFLAERGSRVTSGAKQTELNTSLVFRRK